MQGAALPTQPLPVEEQPQPPFKHQGRLVTYTERPVTLIIFFSRVVSVENLVKRQTHDTSEADKYRTIVIVVVVIVCVYFLILGSVLCSFLVCFVHCDDGGKPYYITKPRMRCCPKTAEDKLTACCARACCSNPDDWDSSETGYRIEMIVLVIVCCPLITFCLLLYGYCTGRAQ